MVDQRKVKHYGLHTDSNGVKHLVQDGLLGNFIGLPVPPPFLLHLEVRKSCPHNMDPSAEPATETEWKELLTMLGDPLMAAMVPLPKRPGGKVSYFDDEFQKLLMVLIYLSAMSSPMRQLVHPITQIPPKKILDELSLTNVAPLVITGLMTNHQSMIERIVHESLLAPRRLILMGHPNVVAYGMFKREVTSLTKKDEEKLSRMPLEKLGLTALRKYSRGEIDGRF